MASNKKPTWKDVKAILVEKEKSELLGLVADLYSASAENKSFIHSRYSIGGKTLEPYKRIISESLYPDVYKNKPIRLSVGKKAISDYFKSTKDKAGQLELMVHYLEMGNQFTVDFGDIDEQFYSSLESMFEKILTALRNQSADVQEKYFSRLEDVVLSARNIGWGYYDYISDIFGEYEIEINST
ncbi:MAG: hypothetical protein QNJ46_32185 [Leptolyngbyaceae cyanobacterium MO_188.B28]|nr:hypothetical protein [Leptolyngbyaceae cyanobacterium MO_188.B28]